MSELCDFLSIKHGWAFKGEYFSDTGDQSILTPGNFYESGGFKRNFDKARFYIGDFPAEFVCKKDDLIVAMTEQAAGLLGSTALVPEDNRYLHNQRIGLIDCNEKMYKYFAYYLFMTKTVREQISRSSSGTKVKHTSPEKIYDVKVTVPKFQDQEKIANLLMALDQKIALNNQINEELEAMAKTLYDYWFVQFDFPDENGKPYKSYGGKMVYNDQLKREIPEGWGVKQLGEICNIVMGQSPSGTSYNEIGEGIVFYQGSTDFGWRYPNVRQFTTAPTRYANENDILLSVRAPVGTLNIANETCCIGRGLAAINSKSGYNSFLFQQMQLYKKEFQLRDATGTTFGSITKDDLFSLSMVIASENLMKRYENIVGKSYDKIKILSKQNKELTQLRDWLLPMLMNGQVKVEE
ncbi:restriction endonuclease subunit S [Streptococcus suis]|nr:restriction endonuclease subunit S [Streptococcus suis]